MILISDSGSTKADWAALSKDTPVMEFSTRGFNPLFHDKSFILEELERNDGLRKIRNQISAVYFFGAGCSSQHRNEIVRSALSVYFSNAIITVEHDMLGCALAVCESKPGLASILGTGSNICFFNGINISETKHGLGYVLGDEGSGSYFGKKLLSRYLYGIMPAHISESFNNKFSINREKIIHQVYREANANVFLASFAPFLSMHPDDAFIRNLVRMGFVEFFETNVLSYPESKNHPVHFVGSIAWNFRDILAEVAALNNVQMGNVIRKPINGLADYFSKGGKIPV